MTLNKKRTTLAGAIKRRKERKQFCAFSARGRFHTAWVKSGPDGPEIRLPVYLEEQTSSDRHGGSVRAKKIRALRQLSGCLVDWDHYGSPHLSDSLREMPLPAHVFDENNFTDPDDASFTITSRNFVGCIYTQRPDDCNQLRCPVASPSKRGGTLRQR
jgi:hypothetical protein